MKVEVITYHNGYTEHGFPATMNNGAKPVGLSFQRHQLDHPITQGGETALSEQPSVQEQVER